MRPLRYRVVASRPLELGMQMLRVPGYCSARSAWCGVQARRRWRALSLEAAPTDVSMARASSHGVLPRVCALARAAARPRRAHVASAWHIER